MTSPQLGLALFTRFRYFSRPAGQMRKEAILVIIWLLKRAINSQKLALAAMGPIGLCLAFLDININVT